MWLEGQENSRWVKVLSLHITDPGLIPSVAYSIPNTARVVGTRTYARSKP